MSSSGRPTQQAKQARQVLGLDGLERFVFAVIAHRGAAQTEILSVDAQGTRFVQMSPEIGATRARPFLRAGSPSSRRQLFHAGRSSGGMLQERLRRRAGGDGFEAPGAPLRRL